jgi:hypothetical protein
VLLRADQQDLEAGASPVLRTDGRLAVGRRVGVERHGRPSRRLLREQRGVHELEHEDRGLAGLQVVQQRDGPGQRPAVGRGGVRAGRVVVQVHGVEHELLAVRAAVHLCCPVVTEVVQGGQLRGVGVELGGDVLRVLPDVLVGDGRRVPVVREHVAPADVHAVGAAAAAGLDPDAVAGDGTRDGTGAGVAEVGVGRTDGQVAAAEGNQEGDGEGADADLAARVVGLGTAHDGAFLCSSAVKACERCCVAPSHPVRDYLRRDYKRRVYF